MISSTKSSTESSLPEKAEGGDHTSLQDHNISNSDSNRENNKDSREDSRKQIGPIHKAMICTEIFLVFCCLILAYEGVVKHETKLIEAKELESTCGSCRYQWDSRLRTKPGEKQNGNKDSVQKRKPNN